VLAVIALAATLADEFDVGDPFANRPGVRVIFLFGPTSVPIGSVDLFTVKSRTVRLIIPLFLVGPNKYPLTVNDQVYKIALRV
jgi:hypothetical protein